MKRFITFLLLCALTVAMSGGAWAEPALAADLEDRFTDVSADAWYAEAIGYCYENGLMNGMSDTTFGPDTSLSRAMVATILYRVEGEPAVAGAATFSDVAPGGWYSSAVAWAEQNSIVSGYGDGTFGVDDPITREQLLTILWRHDGSRSANGAPSFADASAISDWAVQAAVWGGSAGIANAKEGNLLDPKSDATRAETAFMLMNYMELSNINNTGNATDSGFDLSNGTVRLNNGITMPILGIGTYTLSNEQAENSVYWALRDGYRLIDTARIYGNEVGVGRGIQRAINEGVCTRGEIFVTTKMWTTDFGNGDSAIDGSLERLGLEYIDLMILHHSQPSNDVQAYQAMERAVEAGKLRSIGLSNYYTAADFDRLANAVTVTPALLQNETHPYYQSKEIKEHLKQYGTVLESWFPLGGRGNTQVLFSDPTIMEIAEAHGKTPAQIIIRWHLQAGNIAIPGSSNEAHIQENYEVFDFSLTGDEMEKMTALDKRERFADY